MKLAFVIGALLAVGDVWAAQGGNGLAARVAQLEALITSQTSTISTLQRQMNALQGQVARLQGQAHARYTDSEAIAAANVAGAIAAHSANPVAHHVPAADVDPQNVLGLFTRDGNELYLTGANLHIRNGLNATDATPNGLGNLIVGYNGQYCDAFICLVPPRTGSHNVIVGDGHQYTSYGGLAAGLNNTISAASASVSGGKFNIASGEYSSVSGGRENRASGENSSISGGANGSATTDDAHPYTHELF